MTTPSSTPTPTEMHPASTSQVGPTGPFGMTLYPGRRITALLADGQTRRVEITAHADTFFSIPARASIGGRNVRGFVSSETVSGSSVEMPGDPAVFKFTPYRAS